MLEGAIVSQGRSSWRTTATSCIPSLTPVPDSNLARHRRAPPAPPLEKHPRSSLVLNSTQIMDHLNEDFRAARLRFAQLLGWLDSAFEGTQQGADSATDGFNGFFSARDHRDAQLAMERHRWWISSCSTFLSIGRDAQESLEDTQAPWLAACSAYFRKAGRYWRAESSDGELHQRRAWL